MLAEGSLSKYFGVIYFWFRLDLLGIHLTNPILVSSHMQYIQTQLSKSVLHLHIDRPVTESR